MCVLRLQDTDSWMKPVSINPFVGSFSSSCESFLRLCVQLSETEVPRLEKL